MASQDAIQALKAAAKRYEDRKRRLVSLAAFGLPSAFAVAILVGFLFSSFIIPVLPNTWEWPCRLIGAEYRNASDQNSPATFCVIQRE